jgi:hypothetical protein
MAATGNFIPTKFRIIWRNGFRGEESKKSANQKQESPVAAMFLNGSGRNVQYSNYLYTDIRIELQIYASKTLQPNELKLGRNHLWKVLYKDCSLKISQLETRIACGGHVC